MRKLIKQKKKLQQSAGSPLKRNLHPDSPQRHKVTPDRDARLMTKGGIQEVPPRASRRRISFAGGWRSAWHCDVVWYGSQQCRASHGTDNTATGNSTSTGTAASPSPKSEKAQRSIALPTQPERFKRGPSQKPPCHTILSLPLLS